LDGWFEDNLAMEEVLGFKRSELYRRSPRKK
jgi:hypothetical protein